jgi:hypothetical protein
MSEELKTLKSIEGKLEEICKWMRLATKQQLKLFLSNNLETDLEAAIYEMSDGSRSTRDIAHIIDKVSHVTVSRYWKKWSILGLVVPSETYQGRYQKICSLEELGLSVPPVLKNSESKEVGKE